MTPRLSVLSPKFVEFIPKQVEPGILYVSMEYATTAHSCACGCGERVVLPLHPNDWSMAFDGKAVSIRPSVGNWSFPCRSHYFITGNRIDWAAEWSAEEVQAGRDADKGKRSAQQPEPIGTTNRLSETRDTGRKSWFDRIIQRLLGR